MRDEVAESAMFRLYRVFRHRKSLDFALYKSDMISRRVERRMLLLDIPSFDEYMDIVEGDVEESDLLFRDLLVEVTQFFRDPEAFERLGRDVMPNLVRRSDPEAEIRVWVCGCSTGEEAYSIAMLLHDAISRSETPQRKFKVFATDVHRKSLEAASSGFYPVSSLSSVPNEFKEKYFNVNDGLCNLKRELRRSVIFATNDLTRDSPFTRLDFISCRNVLIYLEPRVQKRVLSMFHFGLKKDGILFLGPSETVSDLANEFDQIDRHWRIYGKRRNARLPEATRMPLSPPLASAIRDQAQGYVGSGNQDVKNEMWLRAAYEELLARHVPASILVNEMNELVHCFGEARKLLTVPDGRPSNDILRMLEKNLSISVSAALHRARTENKQVVYKGVRTGSGYGDERIYQVSVEPYSHKSQSLYLVSLEDMGKPVAKDTISEDFQWPTQANHRLERLEQELTHTRETLQSTVADLESSKVELQAKIEDVTAANEELRSTNEDLKSGNQELHAVNAEQKVKIDELIKLTQDMETLFKSTAIGTIFLDRNFNIRMFTPAISAGFNVLEQDVGRPISHIFYKLNNPDLMAEIATVLSTGVSKEREVVSEDHRVFIQRIQPYRCEDRIEGVVLTLTDISDLRKAEEAQNTLQTLSEISQELPDFAYAVSHDLQAPLRHIHYFAELLENAVDENQTVEIKKSVQVLRNSSDKLRGMIDGLLAYSRVNTMGRPLATMELQTAIDAAIVDMESSVHANDATISVADELPTVVGDVEQLKRVFTNVIENSLKFRGEEPPEIVVSCSKVEERVEVRICDNGIGVPDRHKEDVFTIFKRLGFKDGVPGAGVGLAICRRIILRHQGRIWLETHGNGVTVCFSVRIPDMDALLGDKGVVGRMSE